MFLQHHTQAVLTAHEMHGDAACRETIVLPGWGELQRWGSGTSTASSNDWNDIGLPPLPRQRGLSVPSWGSLAQQQLGMSTSVPLPEEYAVHECSLQGSLSLPQEDLGIGFSSAHAPSRYGSSPRRCDVETVYEDASQMWEGMSPAEFTAASAALARARRSHQMLHSSTSMSSTTSACSSSSSSAGGSNHGHSMSRAYSSHNSGSSSPMAVEYVTGGNSAASLPLPCRHGSPSHGLIHQAQSPARLTQHEQHLLGKLKSIVSGQEQLSNLEKHLKVQLGEDSSKALSGSPRAATQAAAMKVAAHQHQLQQQHRHMPGRCSLDGSGHNHSSPSVHRHRHSVPAAPAAASPPRHCNSTAAALLAASVDPAVVAEYMHAHKQQQQQHQACMAAVAAAAAVGGASPRGAAGQARHQVDSHGMNPAAMAKLKQLMALQQQQILIQQELLGMLYTA